MKIQVKAITEYHYAEKFLIDFDMEELDFVDVNEFAQFLSKEVNKPIRKIESITMTPNAWLNVIAYV